MKNKDIYKVFVIREEFTACMEMIQEYIIRKAFCVPETNKDIEEKNIIKIRKEHIFPSLKKAIKYCEKNKFKYLIYFNGEYMNQLIKAANITEGGVEMKTLFGQSNATIESQRNMVKKLKKQKEKETLTERMEEIIKDNQHPDSLIGKLFNRRSKK